MNYYSDAVGSFEKILIFVLILGSFWTSCHESKKWIFHIPKNYENEMTETLILWVVVQLNLICDVLVLM
jgi:hypothetical protein